jgi:hypothetical protein
MPFREWYADKFKGGRVLKGVVKRCFENELIAELEAFCNAEEAGFLDSERKTINIEQIEHKLEWSETHKQFVLIVERAIESELKTHKYTLDKFYKLCESTKTKDESVQAFINLIVNTMEYMVFVEVMISRSRRQYLFNILKQ